MPHNQSSCSNSVFKILNISLSSRLRGHQHGRVGLWQRLLRELTGLMNLLTAWPVIWDGRQKPITHLASKLQSFLSTLQESFFLFVALRKTWVELESKMVIFNWTLDLKLLRIFLMWYIFFGSRKPFHSSCEESRTTGKWIRIVFISQWHGITRNKKNSQ